MTTQLSATEARRTLFSVIDRANDDAEVFEVVGKRGRVFIVPEAEYRGWDETAFLLRSRSNRDRLTAAIAEHRTGQPGVSFTSWDEMEARIDSPDA